MKLCIIVPSQEYLAQAGVRIRYRRIEPYLAALGHSLAIEVIEEFRKPDHLGADVYLFSKCYDARAVTLARLMHAAGKTVGIDLFDDMFSQGRDSRFVRHRTWLRDILPAIGFGLCSTRRMREIFHGYAPALPAHVLNDPFESFDIATLGRRIEEKRQEAIASGTIRTLWFGVGDNPHFTVGLSDLSAFGGEIRRLREQGMDVDLTILTNRRALTDDGLRMIGRLGVPHRVEEWTRERELDLLDENLVSFLPVNGQGFSNAKSLNRAVTALTGGTQVLSVGYPLYAPLADYLYRDAAALVGDIEDGSLRLRADRLPALAETFDQFGDPTREVAKLADFLTGLPKGKKGDSPPLAILHGRRSPTPVHKQVQRLGQLSVATPFSAAGLGYDVRVMPVPDSRLFDVRLTERAQAHLASTAAAHLTADETEPDCKTVRVLASAALADRLAAPPAESLAEISTSYDAVINGVADVVRLLLPKTRPLLSEGEAPLTATLRGKGNGSAPVRILNEKKLQRILFVANAQLPSLHISFIRPLQPYVAEGRLAMRTLTDSELTQKFNRGARSRATKLWLRDELAAWMPTLIVFCRYSGPLAEEYMNFASKRNIPTIFHIDDDLLNLPPEIGAEKHAYHSHPDRMAVIRNLLATTTKVYASTKNLATILERDHLPGALVAGKIYCSAEVRRAPVRRPVRKFDYMGGGDHGYDLDTIVPAIEQILDRHPHLHFEIFGGIAMPAALERFGDRVGVVPPILDYGAFLRHFATMDWDIGICPLVPSGFNACKANTKWIEYTAVGIAVVATRGMAYDECCGDGAGMLASTIEEWVAALDRLVTEDGLCYAQTLTAQKKLREEFSPAALQKQIIDIIEPILKRPLLAAPIEEPNPAETRH